MTLFQIIQILKQIALTQPNIKSATDGSIYEVMNTNPSVKYDVVHFSQTTHQSDEETDYYGLNIFYVSRLEDSLEDNRLQIQSIGKEVLDNIIRTFCENWHIDFPTITYTPFTQKFNDLCAGCYCNLRLEIPKEIICADDFVAEVVPGNGIKLQDIGITITQNGLIVITPDAEYDGIGEIRIQTEVPQSAAVLQDKEVEYTENGSYTVHPDPAYDGLSSVAVDVLVPDNYDEGYANGKEDGINEQKAKLSTTSVTENGTYTRADGWSTVTVDVPSDYQDGYDDGAADQKSKLVPTAITENGTYSREDGYSSIEVNVPQGQGYDEGFNDGEEAQKAKMVASAFTENGTYTREDGYSAITVNVPAVDDRYEEGYNNGLEDGEAAQKAKLVSTAFTQNGTYSREDGYSAITVNVDDRYDEGYDDGYRAGAAACSGLLATAIALNVASAITDSGTATTTYSPSTAYTDIYYTSSDSTIASINENTGVITVLKSGTVTICTKDRMSGLQDCKSVNVIKSYSGDYITAIYNVTSTTSPTKIMNKTTSFSGATLADGTVVPIATGYTFPTTGLNTVKYYVSKTSLDNYLFDSCYQLVEIRMPNSITSIGTEGCFYDCFYLSSVTLPDGITSIPDRTFAWNHRLLSLTIPDSVRTIGTRSFSQCFSLSSLTIPSGVTSIVSGDGASFDHCYILPANFHNNSSLNAQQNQYWGLTLLSTEQADGLCIKGTVAENCRPSATNVTMPNTITEIGDYCFKSCQSLNINNLGWSSALTIIGENAFEGCAFTAITIPESVERIKENCFNACSKLKNVTIGSGILHIEAGAFQQCSAITSMRFLATIPPTISTSTSNPPLGSTSYTFPIYVPGTAVPYYKAASGWSPYADRVRS